MSLQSVRSWPPGHGTLHGRGAETMTDLISYGLLCVGVFAGAFVSGLAGFAFSAVGRASPFHLPPPTQAVPLMMAWSLGVQSARPRALPNNISRQGSPALA